MAQNGSLCVVNRARQELVMNRIIWIVGAIVIVLFILGFLGLR